MAEDDDGTIGLWYIPISMTAQGGADEREWLVKGMNGSSGRAYKDKERFS